MAQIIVDTPTHYETDFIKITYVAEKKRFDEVWVAYGEDEDIKAAKLKEIEMLENFKIDAYLSDMLDFQGASPEVQEWVSLVWFKKAFDAGLRRLAFLLPPDIFGVFAVENVIVAEFALKMKLQKFDNYEDADNWLNQETLD